MSQRIKIKALLESEQTEIPVVVKGWIRTFRNNQFIALNDGSTNNNIQIVVVDFEQADPTKLKRLTTGAAISVTGTLVASLGKGQKVEVKAKAEDIEVLGDSDPEKYPLQPKKHSLEFLREIAHLRFRTNTFGAVFRVRNSLSYAVHTFFQERGFVYLHTPIITASDAEGAGETFHVTNFDLENLPKEDEKLKSFAFTLYESFEDKLNKLGMDLSSINEQLNQFKPDLTFQELVCAHPNEIKKLSYILKDKHSDIWNNLTSVLKDSFDEWIQTTYVSLQTNLKLLDYINAISNDDNSKFDFELEDNWFKLSFYNIKFLYKEYYKRFYSNDFFGSATNLTVSGQLEGELGAMALSDIYTFGPTFRAENSNTTRHLAEFWMIEPEMAFYDLEDNMNLAEALLKYLIGYVLKNNAEDIEFLSQRLEDEEKQKPQQERSDMNLVDKLKFCLDNDFQRLTYTEAIEILKESTPNKKKKFTYPVEGWGTDLQSEHERYLVEKHFKKPVILTDYPKAIKAFYMRQNEPDAQGRETVRAMDILFPGIGEMVGGSQREERLDKLEQRMDEMGIPKDELWWYLDTRRFGACPHAGFGLGFERMVQFVTGMGNIRDVIPFPRFPKNAEF